MPVFDLHTRTWSFVHTNPDPIDSEFLSKVFVLYRSCLDFPTRRKFHSVFPFRPNQVIVFGGADFHALPDLQAFSDMRLWVFDFNQLIWSRLPSLTMIRPTYFHAAAMNEVIRICHIVVVFIQLYLAW